LLCLVNDPGNNPDEDTSQRAARQRREAFDFIGDHLSSVPRVELQRVARTLDLFAQRDMVRGDVGEERERWAAWLGIVSFWVLAPVAVFGAVKTRRRDRAVLLIPVMIVVVTTIVIYGGHRIRSSAEPSIVVFAAVAIGYWLGGQRAHSRAAVQGSDSPESWPTATGSAAASSPP